MERFFKDPKIPYAEFRYSQRSSRVFKPHLHARLSIGAVDQGQVTFHLPDRDYILCPGALALINPDTLHSCNAGHEQARSYYMLYLDMDYCLNIQQSLWKAETFQPMQIALLHDRQIYESYIKALDQLFDPEMATLEKEQILANLTGEILLLACSRKDDPAPTSQHLEDFKLLLSTNLADDITLNQLADHLRVNPFTLLRQFRSTYGVTPHAYRLNCRIEKARTLLQQGMDIADTALECGFFDQSHFHKAFKAATTVTPKEYQVNFLQ